MVNNIPGVRGSLLAVANFKQTPCYWLSQSFDSSIFLVLLSLRPMALPIPFQGPTSRCETPFAQAWGHEFRSWAARLVWHFLRRLLKASW